jgi:trans-aconitate methyltransferase
LGSICAKEVHGQIPCPKELGLRTPIAQEWHTRALDVIAAQIGKEQWGNALESGCSEGIFTSYLVGRYRSAEAFDISPIARDRASVRCAQFSNVRIGSLDLANHKIEGQYDLVFAMDIS